MMEDRDTAPFIPSSLLPRTSTLLSSPLVFLSVFDPGVHP